MLSFTPQERQVILFLLAIALFGAGINFFLKTYTQIKLISGFNENLGKLDLNQADKTALMSVSGIGEKIATRILDYRRNQAGFQDIGELRNIEGITEHRYEKLKDAFFVQ